jgi:hypothetical protein
MGMGQTEPQFLSAPMSDKKKKFSPTLLTRYNFYFLWVKIKKINIVYHFPQYELLRIVLCHYDLCWFLVVYGFDKSTWTWSGKTVLFWGRSWKSPLEHQRRCHRLNKQYEQKRSRSFKLHWTTERPWLRYDEHEQIMYCTYGTAKNSGFLFRSENKFRTTQELEYLFFLSRNARNFFPEFNIRLYDKNSESDYFFY